MLFISWQQNPRPASPSRRIHQKNRRAAIRRAAARPRLELLEDRTVLSSVSFGLPTSFSVGPNVQPESVVVGDFNGDGKPDLVTPDAFSNSVSVLLGKGDGTFQSAQSYGTGTPTVYDFPVYVAVGDLNGDHKLDLVVANENSDTFSVLLGNGNGTFQAAQDSATGGRLPASLSIADFNGDGKPDLAIANLQSGDTVSVLLGNGDGTFKSAQNFGVGVTPNGVAVGDLNGDGKLDLAVSTRDTPAVSVVLGNGDGTFQASKQFGAAGEPYGLTVADLNGDGKLDLAVADLGTSVSVLLGNGDGTFQDAEDFPSGFYPTAVVAADFNSDGKPDLAVVNELNSSVSVLLNDFVTTTALSGPSSSSYGQPLTYTAKVESGGAPLTVGVVTFVVSGPDGGATVFTATLPLDAGGQATLSIPTLNADTYSISAVYNDTPGGLGTGFGPSTGTASLIVNPAALSVTGINLSAIAGVPFTGAIATFANPDPSGNYDAFSALITWGDGSTSFGSITGSATLTVSGPYTYAHAGTHPVTVQITNYLGNTTTATTSLTASVSTLVRSISYRNNKHGQALIDGFNGSSSATALATWLATSFPHLYGSSAGADNLTGEPNLEVAAFYQTQFALPGSHLEAEVLATALNVYATTQSLGGNTGKAHHFIVSAGGLGADSFNVGADGAAFGVANNTALDVYDLLKATDRQYVSGVLCNGNKSLQKLAKNLFHGLNTPGSIS